MTKKILVTGAAGFIGSALCKRLIETNDNLVVGLDNFLTGKPSNLPKAQNFKFLRADVNEKSALRALMYSEHFDFVFHYAAVVGVKRTLDNPLLVLRDIEGIREILELSTYCGVKRFFYASSSEVYGEPVEIPQNEDTTPLNSRLPYAIVKNVGEAMVRSFASIHGLNYTIFRFFNTYGPAQSDDFVMARFIDRALNNEELEIYGDGMQTRTFCYIDDNLQATLAALNEGLEINQTINIGSDRETTIKDLAYLIIEMTGSDSRVVHRPSLKEGDMSRRCPDNTRFRLMLRRDLVSLEQGIKRILEYPR